MSVITDEAFGVPDLLETRSYNMILFDGRRYAVRISMMDPDLNHPTAVALRDMDYVTFGVVQYGGSEPINLIWAIGPDNVPVLWPQGGAKPDEIVIQVTFETVKSFLGDFYESCGLIRGSKTLH